MFATDIERYILGARDFDWPLLPLQAGIKKAGFCCCAPPHSVVVGEFTRTFPRLHVIGLRVTGRIDEGCPLCVLSESGYQVLIVESIETSKTRVSTVRKGDAGIKVQGTIAKLIEGSIVYRILDPPHSGSGKSDTQSHPDSD
jgi:hypothetical protein